MSVSLFKRRASALGVLVVIFVLVVVLWPAPLGTRVGAQESTQIIPNIPVIPAGSAYRQTNFISDIPGLAFTQDPFLINPWGIAFRGTSPFWVSQNGTISAALFRGDISGSPMVLNPGLNLVTVPGGSPTGVVGNAT